jgi:hypothetical protein
MNVNTTDQQEEQSTRSNDTNATTATATATTTVTSSSQQELLWLSSRLNAEWSAEKIASQLNLDLMKHLTVDISNGFECLDTPVKVRLLLSVLSLKKKALVDMGPYFNQLFDKLIQNEQEDDWIKVISGILRLFPDYHVLKSDVLDLIEHYKEGGLKDELRKTIDHFKKLEVKNLCPLFTKYLQEQTISMHATSVEEESNQDRWKERVQQHSHFKLKMNKQAQKDALLQPIAFLSQKEVSDSRASSPVDDTTTGTGLKKLGTKPAPVAVPTPTPLSGARALQTPTPTPTKTQPSFLRTSRPNPSTPFPIKQRSGISATAAEPRVLKQLDDTEVMDLNIVNDNKRKTARSNIDQLEKDRRKKERAEAKEKKEQEKKERQKKKEEDKKRKAEEMEKKKEERKKKKEEKAIEQQEKKKQKKASLQINTPISVPINLAGNKMQSQTPTSMTSPFGFTPQQMNGPLVNPFSILQSSVKPGTPTTPASASAVSPYALANTFAALPVQPNSTQPMFTPYAPQQTLPIISQFQVSETLKNTTPFTFSPQQIATDLTRTSKLLAQLPGQPQSQGPTNVAQLPKQPQTQPSPSSSMNSVQENQLLQLENYLNSNLLQQANRVTEQDKQRILKFLCGRTDPLTMPSAQLIEQILIHEEIKDQEIHQIYFQMDHRQKTWKKFLKKTSVNKTQT